MDNNINSLSFKANLKPTFIVKNSKRFDNIARKFSFETNQFPNETFDLYVSEIKNGISKEPKIALHLSTVSSAGHSENVFVTDTLDKQYETMTDAQIAKRLAKIFKVLHYRDVLIKKLPEIKNEYERSTLLIEKLKPRAEKGKEKKLIEQLESIIIYLQNKYKNINKIAKQNIKQAIRGDEELKEFTKDIL